MEYNRRGDGRLQWRSYVVTEASSDGVNGM